MTDTARPEQVEDFVRELLRAWDFSGDIDGGQLQDMAIKHGVLKEVVITEPCGDDYTCRCINYYHEDDYPAICCRVNLPEVGK